ncbi:hypothetical protein NLU13_4803 [Sarocladium strictum]|uniref:Uncharacterized protein n=1 Tax=Sarocladium strictum TaxID=5046 RepID=A0AA39GJK7_SARSR|nr:hypothetical protein NLU13_4803 [Sarocladium strictum]
MPILESARDKVGSGDVLKPKPRAAPGEASDHPDSKDFLDLVNESLVIQKSRKLKSEESTRRLRERTASSDYPSEGQRSPPLRTVASPVCGGSLNLAEMAKYGSATYNLSDLRSRTSSSKTHTSGNDNSHHEAVAVAEAAATEWRGETQRGRSRTSSYGQYELAESCEVLPLDSLSQQNESTDTLAVVTPIPKTLASPKTRKASEVTFASTPHVCKNYDGRSDSNHSDSPNPSREPRRQAAPLGSGKRSASHFSLRSFTESLSKRPRLGIKRLASSVYRNSKRVLKQMHHNIKHQNDQGRRDFEAWRAKRRRQDHPADPLKGKPEKGSGAFAFKQRRRKDEDWWTEGVERYHAPEWMKFH